MCLLLLLLLMPLCLLGQADTLPPAAADTLALPQVQITAPTVKPSPMETAAFSLTTIGAGQIHQQPNNTSLVAVLNQVPGVRMEERSPGSYRLSIRGSLLRSPFGVRNVKFYLIGELAFTDASGNTYFNLLEGSALERIEIFKGPYASIHGANTGGVVHLYPSRLARDTATIIHLAAGSFGLAKVDAHWKKNWQKYSLQIDQSYQRADGYRRNSQMQRHLVQAVQQWRYKPKTQLTLYHLLARLQYETPGGLTLPQANIDPTAARHPTPTLPSAAQQQAGIYNTTTYHGAVHQWQINQRLRHVVSAWGSYTDFKNPFITNYEVRKEHTLGARTYIQWQKHQLRFTNGYEYLYTFTNFSNYGNLGGQRTALQVADGLKAQQQFVFTQLAATLWLRLHLEASASASLFKYGYQNQYPVLGSATAIGFKPQVMPRLKLSFQARPTLFISTTVSRGYSPPTLAEVRPSTNIVSPNLQAEHGWNYELGFQYHYKNLLGLQANIYYFRLQDAIVRREDVNGNEFFVNAGGTNQTGIELQGKFILFNKQQQVLRNVLLVATYTYQHFQFRQYQAGASNYSGNWLTGVPRQGATATLNTAWAQGVYANIVYQYVAKTPLNDANEVYAPAYHLLQARIGYQKQIKKRTLELYLSADNILNQFYSLGNDINAFGGRYYNPAPSVNFLGGIRLSI